ncbi:4Fe-4S cluster-binding domain-containing protein [Alcanivorax profundi]|uniref:S-adenosylmethionine-dependent nucleotide dehydratase n=1 Tax=Alcanivorax profundi TaxID=2338368 RepID=A0A418XYZ6_9GAMM|nr:viperin family antiviral radical SAM protein [Alcanivorax profundi]RJG18246.1 4Fe-4S cluster-binding domain-containing protein [Alcanivorax profundi]
MKDNNKELVINWHITEVCNYDCQYCFAKWEEHAPREEVCRDAASSRALLGELSAFFSPDNPDNPLHSSLQWGNIRLNIAGGEPMLHDSHFYRVIEQAAELGMKVSIITNGSYLNTKSVSRIAPYLSWLGISIDSSLPTSNRIIGRSNVRGTQLDLKRMPELLNLARSINPDLRIKINTVVNSENHKEDFHPLIEALSPDKWKIFKVLPIINRNLQIHDHDYEEIVLRHSFFKQIMYPENNEEMRESYIMIDPKGRFFQNGEANLPDNYRYSQPIHEAGAKQAFSQIRFSSRKFDSRYRTI